MPDFSSGIGRRDILRTAATAVGAGCAVVASISQQATAQQRPQKAAKAEVHYQEQPNGQQHCEMCAYYLPPVACRVVRGEVSPNGWCNQFQAKAGSAAESQFRLYISRHGPGSTRARPVKPGHDDKISQ